jgi:hypothetical protein
VSPRVRSGLRFFPTEGVRMSKGEEFEESSEGFRNLRKAYEKAISERDAALAEVAPLRTQIRTRTIADKLGELGVNTKVARFIPADVELDKLDGWLGENADVFGIDLSPKDDTANTAEAAAQSRVNGVESGGTALPSGDEQAAQQVGTLSEADLRAAIFNAQLG